MEIVIHQQIYYSNKKLIPIKDVAESLIALEAIYRQSPDILEAIFPNTEISSVEVYISELKSDSLWEDIVVKFLFKDQKNLDSFIANLRESVGMDNIMNDGKLLAVITIAIIFIGGFYILNQDKSSTPEQKTIIEANNNTIIQIGAGLVDFSAQDFKALIDNAIKDKKSLAQNAAKVVVPAKRDPDATITFNKNNDLVISNEAIRAMPRFAQVPENEPYIEDFKNIELQIRAIDLDSNKRGWAVVIPEIHVKRIRLQLDPGIKPEVLIGIRKIMAEVTVIFEYDDDDNKIPKLVFLRKIND